MLDRRGSPRSFDAARLADADMCRVRVRVRVRVSNYLGDLRLECGQRVRVQRRVGVPRFVEDVQKVPRVFEPKTPVAALLQSLIGQIIPFKNLLWPKG